MHSPIEPKDRYYFRKFARTLIQRPDLAANMQDVFLDSIMLYGILDFDSTESESGSEENFKGLDNAWSHIEEKETSDIFSEAVWEMDIGNKDILLKRLERGKEDAEVALFLWYLPDLRSLTLDSPPNSTDSPILGLVKAATTPGTGRPFSNLSCLKLV
ncbi:uncharacterized protein K452DRAFT_357199 [Aplosporella prunicola CBS 121167]|uniref:Uncharacterized protein n=1 Tax=Aplosporella prunicola CBS 121167 TaxID=1176127 RepID=A0A6A6BL03_9PEZI|nr:uncharacterized protein K452DRAFT_357199 [Aplosporella prunicola CBS 121167]KAF2144348.1 hypothetical protein K452DRAFT_357199 [Aplosporella prunicola CBS 121167]